MPVFEASCLPCRTFNEGRSRRLVTSQSQRRPEARRRSDRLTTKRGAEMLKNLGRVAQITHCRRLAFFEDSNPRLESKRTTGQPSASVLFALRTAVWATTSLKTRPRLLSPLSSCD